MTPYSKDGILHYWGGLTNQDLTNVEYMMPQEAPFQDSTYHEAGYFLNSSDGHIIEELEKRISKENQTMLLNTATKLAIFPECRNSSILFSNFVELTFGKRIGKENQTMCSTPQQH